jgi:hypothetical protein
VQPILEAIEPIAAHSEACSPRCSDTIRTARARTSGEYLVCLVIAPSSREPEPPANPVRFRASGDRRLGEGLDQLPHDRKGRPSTLRANSQHVVDEQTGRLEAKVEDAALGLRVGPGQDRRAAQRVDGHVEVHHHARDPTCPLDQENAQVLGANEDVGQLHMCDRLVAEHPGRQVGPGGDVDDRQLDSSGASQPTFVAAPIDQTDLPR